MHIGIHKGIPVGIHIGVHAETIYGSRLDLYGTYTGSISDPGRACGTSVKGHREAFDVADTQFVTRSSLSSSLSFLCFVLFQLKRFVM